MHHLTGTLASATATQIRRKENFIALPKSTGTPHLLGPAFSRALHLLGPLVVVVAIHMCPTGLQHYSLFVDGAAHLRRHIRGQSRLQFGAKVVAWEEWTLFIL